MTSLNNFIRHTNGHGDDITTVPRAGGADRPTVSTAMRWPTPGSTGSTSLTTCWAAAALNTRHLSGDGRALANDINDRNMLFS
ncbi:unnamed protein product [Leptidea sinapis]|uniref:Uncharacterized protein n=1 Tax=Leptidea sinapis TaxID=189913 RepID=A0A5E4QWS1_9NEOP|nr:unnamed protein product [Leptidea sinapis]